MHRPIYAAACLLLLAGLTGLLQGCCQPAQTPPVETTTQTQVPVETTTQTQMPVETTLQTPAGEETTGAATQAATEPVQTTLSATVATEPVTPPTTAPIQPTTTPTQLSATVDPEDLEKEAQVLPDSQAAVTNLSTVEAPGILVEEDSDARIDYSNTDDGYVMVRYDGTSGQRLKVQVKGPVTTYTYNLPHGQWAAFPLSDENGQYRVTVYINVVDTKYAALLSATIDVDMTDEFEPFLRSNQYVNFDAAPNTVAQAAALAGGMTDPLDKVSAVYHYVTGNISYDKELAATVTSGYLPNLDSVLARKTGICFDYAALMTGMLRSQGVPTKLVVGYAGSAYHAWINVWSESTGWVDGVIFFDGTSWKRMDPTFAASGGDGILDYIGDGTNYSAKYFY